MKLEGCHALITGASAGIGREFARQLAGRASSLVLVARREERLQELRDELTKRFPNLSIHVRRTDLSNPKETEELIAWLEREKIEVDFLINNAGIGDLGHFATIDPARIDQILSVNIVALTMLTRRLLPQMIARKRGAILNVSSSACFTPVSGFAVYAASKAFVTNFSEALRPEVRGKGVTVCTLCPGPVHTEFMQIAQRPDKRPYMAAPELAHVSAEEVARAGLAAVQKNQPLVIPGFLMKCGMFFVRLTPMSILRLASRITAKRDR
jgi:short-subunit dehydrogenase